MDKENENKCIKKSSIPELFRWNEDFCFLGNFLVSFGVNDFDLVGIGTFDDDGFAFLMSD